jgi:prepilin-type N-terminal cleavage/methylation domain-containing protein
LVWTRHTLSRDYRISRTALTSQTPLLGKGAIRAESIGVPRAFTIVELLVVIAIVAVLAGLAVTAMPGLMERAERADALAKTRTMGQAVLQYVPDHAGKLPPLFPGQVLEYAVDASSPSARITSASTKPKTNTSSPRSCRAPMRVRPFRPIPRRCVCGS